MKRKLAVLTGIFFLVLFSGCTFGGNTQKTNQTIAQQKYTLSKSLWLSRDGGKNWEVSNMATNKSTISDINPLSLVFDSNDANIAYAGLREGGIIKTRDGGATWEFLPFKTEKVYGLDVDFIDSKIVYASTVLNGRGKIAKSIDGGVTWNEIYTFATNGPLVTYLTIDKKNTGTIYAATSDNQIIKSMDGGNTWRNIFQSSAPIIKISLDAQNSKILYLLAKNGLVFFSSDAGNNFENLTSKIALSGVSDAGFYVLETDPIQTKGLYLAGKDGIIHTKDGGANWEKITALNNTQNSPITALAINPTNSSELVYGALQATYESIDGGKTWTTAQFDIPKTINIIKYNPINSNIIFASFVSK